MNDHPRLEELRALVATSLDAPAAEPTLLEHLRQCDECFRVYEEEWALASEGLPEIREAFLDSTRSQRLEGVLFHRIHVASLGTASSWLVTEGFLRVLLGVLLPILDYEAAPSSRTRGDDHDVVRIRY